MRDGDSADLDGSERMWREEELCRARRQDDGEMRRANDRSST